MKPINPKLARMARLMSPLWRPLGWWQRSCSANHSPRSILVFDFHLLGDVVLLTPFLASLRRAYPESHLTLVAGPWAAEILAGNGDVDELISFSAPWVKYHQGLRGWLQCLSLIKRLRAHTFDLGIEMRGDVRQILLLWLSGARRRVGFDFTGGGPLLTDVVPDDGKLAHLAEHHRRMACALGIWPDGEPYRPVLSLTDTERDAAQTISPYVGLHFDASLPLRRFPPAEILTLISRVLEGGQQALCLFLPPTLPAELRICLEEAQRLSPARIELWSGTLREFIIKVSRAQHFYAMDSGPAHIAAALGVPVTVFFGPAEFENVRPLGEKVGIVSRPDVPCRPCDQVHCTNAHHQFCMQGLAQRAPLPSAAGSQANRTPPQ